MFYKFTKKTTNIYILVTLFLLFCVGIGVFYKVNLNNTISTDNNIKEIDNSYVVLDDKILDQSDLKEWKDEKKNKQGSSIASDSEYTYALISYGEANESDINLCLENVTFGKYINIEYSILKGKDSVKTQNYIPTTLLLRFNGSDRDIKFNQSENNN